MFNLLFLYYGDFEQLPAAKHDNYAESGLAVGMRSGDDRLTVVLIDRLVHQAYPRIHWSV